MVCVLETFIEDEYSVTNAMKATLKEFTAAPWEGLSIIRLVSLVMSYFCINFFRKQQ